MQTPLRTVPLVEPGIEFRTFLLKFCIIFATEMFTLICNFLVTRCSKLVWKRLFTAAVSQVLQTFNNIKCNYKLNKNDDVPLYSTGHPDAPLLPLPPLLSSSSYSFLFLRCPSGASLRIHAAACKKAKQQTQRSSEVCPLWATVAVQ